ncbi:hypothetical protein BD779DRAFT_1576034 [Infundibulicybe gibba]|nr:hypothetical protein BD779DRAFT_1576034 [Infundibulicybe gibba]
MQRRDGNIAKNSSTSSLDIRKRVMCICMVALALIVMCLNRHVEFLKGPLVDKESKFGRSIWAIVVEDVGGGRNHRG